MRALSVACTAAAVVWAYLVLGHGGYWRASQRLPPVQAPSPSPAEAAPDPAVTEPSPAAAETVRWPDVAAVIPAPNEAAMFPVVLPALLRQDYPAPLTATPLPHPSPPRTPP